MAEKNVTTLVALVEQSSQELCDLYRKAANLDAKTVLEGGHNNQAHGSIQFYMVCWFRKTHYFTLIKAKYILLKLFVITIKGNKMRKTETTLSSGSFSPSVKLAKMDIRLLSSFLLFTALMFQVSLYITFK